jgi:hypothetical protein
VLDDYLPKNSKLYSRRNLNGRSMLVQKSQNGCLSNAWCVATYSGLHGANYSQKGSIAGIKMPAGLLESQHIGKPSIYTNPKLSRP